MARVEVAAVFTSAYPKPKPPISKQAVPCPQPGDDADIVQQPYELGTIQPGECREIIDSMICIHRKCGIDTGWNIDIVGESILDIGTTNGSRFLCPIPPALRLE